jgi:hypothetical protein
MATSRWLWGALAVCIGLGLLLFLLPADRPARVGPVAQTYRSTSPIPAAPAIYSRPTPQVSRDPLPNPSAESNATSGARAGCGVNSDCGLTGTLAIADESQRAPSRAIPLEAPAADAPETKTAAPSTAQPDLGSPPPPGSAEARADEATKVVLEMLDRHGSVLDGSLYQADEIEWEQGSPPLSTREVIARFIRTWEAENAPSPAYDLPFSGEESDQRGASPASESPAPPAAASVAALREVCRQLEAAANLLEEADCYDRADQIRDLAQQIRCDARSIVRPGWETGENPTGGDRNARRAVPRSTSPRSGSRAVSWYSSLDADHQLGALHAQMELIRRWYGPAQRLGDRFDSDSLPPPARD